ncbi:MAG: putative sugar O-methyltransferase [Rhodospirillales bacterium]|nr:putative sugar O-methyltransferase [Rhodospirillales bacterium]
MSSRRTLLDQISKSFHLAQADIPEGQKSVHWDVFPGDYARVFDIPEAWQSFRRNALTVGLNDDIVAFVEDGNLAAYGAPGDTPWKLRARHDYHALLPRDLTGEKEIGTVINALNLVMAVCGVEYTAKHLDSDIGAPASVPVDLADGSGSARRVLVNFHDLPLIYHAWQMSRIMATSPSVRPVVAEIGGGYGGLAAKLKMDFPDALCILLDLPEVTAVQHYYLAERFPGARIVDYAMWKAGGADALSDADFAVLPGWVIAKLAPASVSAVLNVRSMMEMTHPAIEFYFTHIQRVTLAGGLFYCANRYEKGEDPIRIKDYPFDDFWRIVLSQSSPLQGHIHELVARRMETAAPFPVRAALKSLPPH